jgi:hypothetical protein
MPESLLGRVVDAARIALADDLKALCHEIGAAESSILFPAGAGELRFFASNNPRLMQADAPRVPIGASFSGIAYRTGQSVAIADAAGQKQHFAAVDATTKERTREFAAIPIGEREVLGVLTLVNRADATATASPFTLAELRRAERFAHDIAVALRSLPGLCQAGLEEGAARGALGHELVEVLTHLDEAERRVVRALAGAIVENRRT